VRHTRRKHVGNAHFLMQRTLPGPRVPGAANITGKCRVPSGTPSITKRTRPTTFGVPASAGTSTSNCAAVGTSRQTSIAPGSSMPRVCTSSCRSTRVPMGTSIGRMTAKRRGRRIAPVSLARGHRCSRRGIKKNLDQEHAGAPLAPAENRRVALLSGGMGPDAVAKEAAGGQVG
jgi:hypothetical protein